MEDTSMEKHATKLCDVRVREQTLTVELSSAITGAYATSFACPRDSALDMLYAKAGEALTISPFRLRFMQGPDVLTNATCDIQRYMIKIRRRSKTSSEGIVRLTYVQLPLITASNAHRYLLGRAIAERSLRALETLLSTPLCPNTQPPRMGVHNMFRHLALQLTVWDDWHSGARLLLMAMADPNAKAEPHQLSPLALSTQCANISITKLLLCYGADPNEISDMHTPLERAVIYDKQDVCTLLLEARADCRTRGRLTKMTPVELACLYEHFEIARSLDADIRTTADMDRRAHAAAYRR